MSCQTQHPIVRKFPDAIPDASTREPTGLPTLQPTNQYTTSAHQQLPADTETTPEILSQNSPKSLRVPDMAGSQTARPSHDTFAITDRITADRISKAGGKAESLQSSGSCSTFGSSPDFANPRSRRLYPSASDGQRQFPFRILPVFTANSS
jgi:hypothetical protein